MGFAGDDGVLQPFFEGQMLHLENMVGQLSGATCTLATYIASG